MGKTVELQGRHRLRTANIQAESCPLTRDWGNPKVKTMFCSVSLWDFSTFHAAEAWADSVVPSLLIRVRVLCPHAKKLIELKSMKALVCQRFGRYKKFRDLSSAVK